MRTRLLLLTVIVALVFPTAAFAQSASGSLLDEGLAKYRAGNLSAAIPALERALAVDSTQAQAYVVLASALLQTGASARARAVAEDGLDRFPDRFAMRVAKAEALMEEEQWSAALRTYEMVEQQHRSGRSLPSQLSIDQVNGRIGQLHRLVGQKHLEAGRLEAALDHFKAARASLPNSAETHADVAAVHLQQSNWQAADAAAQKGLERAPDHVRLLRIRSEALSQLEDVDTLVPVLERLYQLQPNDADVGLAYGRALLASGEQTKGQKLFSTLLDRHPKEPKVYDALIRLNRRQLNYDAALTILRRQRSEFPADPELAMREGRLLEEMGEYDAARNVYDSTQALTGPEDISPMMASAETFTKQDRLQTAADVYQQLLDQNPTHEGALRKLGRIYEKQENWRDARVVYERLRDKGEDMVDAYHKLGRIYEELDDSEQAFRAYRRAIDGDADHPLPYYRYAVLLHRSPEGGDAFSAAERALHKSLHALKSLQENQLQRLQMSTPHGGLPVDESGRLRDRLEQYDRVAKEAFRFFANTFSAEQTEPVITDLLNQYDSAGRLHYLVGTYYQVQDRSEHALEHFRHAVREAPQLRAAHLALGALYRNRGSFRTAVQAYERARTLDEQAAEPYRGLLDLYQQRGELETLIRRWQGRYRSTPENDVLREHLIEALHKAGRYDDARSLVRTDSTSQ